MSESMNLWMAVNNTKVTAYQKALAIEEYKKQSKQIKELKEYTTHLDHCQLLLTEIDWTDENCTCGLVKLLNKQ